MSDVNTTMSNEVMGGTRRTDEPDGDDRSTPRRRLPMTTVPTIAVAIAVLVGGMAAVIVGWQASSAGAFVVGLIAVVVGVVGCVASRQRHVAVVAAVTVLAAGTGALTVVLTVGAGHHATADRGDVVATVPAHVVAAAEAGGAVVARGPADQSFVLPAGGGPTVTLDRTTGLLVGGGPAPILQIGWTAVSALHPDGTVAWTSSELGGAVPVAMAADGTTAWVSCQWTAHQVTTCTLIGIDAQGAVAWRHTDPPGGIDERFYQAPVSSTTDSIDALPLTSVRFTGAAEGADPNSGTVTQVDMATGNVVERMHAYDASTVRDALYVATWVASGQCSWAVYDLGSATGAPVWSDVEPEGCTGADQATSVEPVESLARGGNGAAVHVQTARVEYRTPFAHEVVRRVEVTAAGGDEPCATLRTTAETAVYELSGCRAVVAAGDRTFLIGAGVGPAPAPTSTTTPTT